MTVTTDLTKCLGQVGFASIAHVLITMVKYDQVRCFDEVGAPFKEQPIHHPF